MGIYKCLTLYIFIGINAPNLKKLLQIYTRASSLQVLKSSSRTPTIKAKMAKFENCNNLKFTFGHKFGPRMMFQEQIEYVFLFLSLRNNLFVL